MLGNRKANEGARKKTGTTDSKSRMSLDTSKRPPRVKSPPGECKSPQDNQMDSGFMSESNLLSSTSLCSEEIGSKDIEFPRTPNSEEGHLNQNQSKTHLTCGSHSGTLDSGIDLSDRISSLNLSGSLVSPSSPTGTSDTLAITADTSGDVPQKSRSKLVQLGLSPLHIARLKEIFKKDTDGDTQLHIAVIKGFIEGVWHITRLLPHQALIDIPNSSGRTALHLAVASGDVCLARHLIVCGSSPVAKNRKGDTPLHIACRGGDPNMVSGLTSQVTVYEVVAARLSYPPNHTPGLLAADLNNYDGQTCIHIAAQFGHKEILQHLTWYGADVNAKEGKCGRTALHLAVEARNKDIIRFLVKTCMAALSIQNYAGLTPYQLAVANDVPEIISLLEELGAKKDPLPFSYAAEDDLDYEEQDSASNFETEEEYPWAVDDLRIGGVQQVPLQYAYPIPVSTHSPLNADRFL